MQQFLNNFKISQTRLMHANRSKSNLDKNSQALPIQAFLGKVISAPKNKSYCLKKTVLVCQMAHVHTHTCTHPHTHTHKVVQWGIKDLVPEKLIMQNKFFEPKRFIIEVKAYTYKIIHLNRFQRKTADIKQNVYAQLWQ